MSHKQLLGWGRACFQPVYQVQGAPGMKLLWVLAHAGQTFGDATALSPSGSYK